MRRIVAPCLLAALLVGPALAAPPAEAAAERARVEALLRAYHATPDRAAFEAAAAEPAKLLRAIAADPQHFEPARRAAFDALRAWPDARTEALYLAHLGPEQPAGIRHAVLRALPALGDRALAPLEAALADPDAELRITAAYALFDLPGDAARAALERRAKREPDAHARREMGRLLEQRAILR